MKSLSIAETLGTTLGVYLGLTWGFALQQADSASRAILQLQASNATAIVPTWVSQAHDGIFLAVEDTLVLSLLYVMFLVIPRLPLRAGPKPIFLLQLFPIVTAGAWLILLTAAILPAVPQPFLSIRACPPSTSDINFSIQQIFVFLEFSRAYTSIAQALTLLTLTWLAAVVAASPWKFKPRMLVIFIPIVGTLPMIFGIPIPNAVIGPCVWISGSGSIEVLPQWWPIVGVPIAIFSLLLLFMVLGGQERLLSAEDAEKSKKPVDR